MSTPESSRRRNINFNSKEIDILINLVAKYKDRIECRKTDRTSNNTKNEAWVQLAKEFNSISGVAYREAKILRNKYDNIKRRSKQRFADEKMYRRGTGGGPEKPFVMTEVDEKLKSIIGSQMMGFESEFDGDRENLSSTASGNLDIMDVSHSDDPQTQSEIEWYEHDEEEEGTFEIPKTSASYSKENSVTTDSQLGLTQLDISTPSTSTWKDSSATTGGPQCVSSNMEMSATSASCSKENSIATNWSKYIPSQLRTPKSLPLKTKHIAKNNKENFGNCSSQSQLSHKIITCASNKAHIADEHLKFLREEYELKLKLVKEKHEQEMRIAEEESEQRRHYSAQQAELKLEVLREQLQNK